MTPRTGSHETTRRTSAGVEAHAQSLAPAERSQARAQFAAVFRGVADAVVVQDPAGRIVYANDAAARSIGASAGEQLADLDVGELVANLEVLDELGVEIPAEEYPAELVLRGSESAQRTVQFRLRATGAERWAIVRASPVHDDDGNVRFVVNVFEDVTGRKRAEARLRFLAGASDLLGASLDWEATLAGIARLAVPTLADWSIVDVVDDTGGMRQVAVAAADPRKEEILGEMRRRYQPTPDSPQPAARALRAGETVLFPEFTPDSLAETVRDAEHLRLICELDPKAAMAVPLVARGHTLGAITFARCESGRGYSSSDVALAEEVARRAAQAIDNARLFRAEQEARTAAETAHERLAFLARAGELLNSSLDYEQTLARVAELAVPELADWCVVDMADSEGRLRRLAVAHVDPAKVELSRELQRRWPPSPDAPAGPANVVRTGEPEYVEEISDELLVASARDEEHLRVLRAIGLRSYMSVPIKARGGVLGVITFVGERPELRYGEHELALATDLARRAATAIENALLFREAEAAIRAREESLAVLDNLYATAPIGLAFFDRSLRYVRINEALAEINGLPVSEHIGRTAEEVLPEMDPAVFEDIRRVLETGEPIVGRQVTGETPAAPGQRRHWHASYYPVRQPDGEVIGIGATVLEITERKRAENALRFLAASSELLAASLDYEATLSQLANLVVPALADQCIVDLLEDDGSTRTVAVAHVDPRKNDVLREMRRRYPPSVPGHPVQAALETRETQFLPELTDEAIAAMAHDAEHRDLIRDLGNRSGIVIPLVARGRTLGTITLGSVPPRPAFTRSDVSVAEELARRAAVAVDNARLYRAAEARGHAVLALSYIGDGVFLVDSDGVIRLWNPAAAAVTGLRAEDVVGRRVAAALRGWGQIAEQLPIATAPARGEGAVTVPLELADRELWLSISAVGFPGGTVYAFRDLTEERALEELRTEFVSTVSHELRTPLAAVYGAALTLRRADLALDETSRQTLLDVIANEADRLARTINDILWASRLDTDSLHIRIESCDGAQLARGVVDAARAHLPENVELRLDSADGLPPVAGDPDKVRQVLTNLVDNAVKYSPDGGIVTLTVDGRERAVQFSVRDEGLGIPPAEQRRIFDKFYRLDPNLTRGVGGTGLGLYICRELARRMGGRIWVDSREGAGSTFTFELPAADTAPVSRW